MHLHAATAVAACCGALLIAPPMLRKQASHSAFISALGAWYFLSNEGGGAARDEGGPTGCVEALRRSEPRGAARCEWGCEIM